MTSPLRHLLVFDATLQTDPYLCWLYAAQFVATAKVEAATVGFMPMFPYGGPDPGRLGVAMIRGSGRAPWRKRRRVLEMLGFKDPPGVTLTSQTSAKARLTKLVDQGDGRLTSVILFGRQAGDVAELAKLVHMGCRDFAPAMVAVVQQPPLTEIAESGLRQLGIPVYLDIGFDHGEDVSELPAGFSGAFSFWSEAEYPLPAQRGPDADWSVIRAGASSQPRAPVVLFLRPDWPNSGSFTTFRSIALRYAQRGTVLIDIALDADRRKYSAAEAAERLAESKERLSPAVSCLSTRSRTWQTLLAHWRRGPRGLVAEHVGRYTRAAAPLWLREMVRAARPDYAYVNHYFTLDYLECLQPNIPLILDTHDIQSVNYIHHKFSSKRKARSELFSDLFRQEIAYYSRARSVAFVNADELELVAAELPSMDLFQFIAIPAIATASEASVAGIRNDVFPAGVGDERRARPRILIVSSRNPGNVANIEWFAEHVWPRIESTGATLDLVGTIAIHFERKPVPERWTLHGHVPAVGGFYAQADIVALPIIKGAGVAIKTIEALQFGRPICATSHAFRGLGKPVQALFPRVDNAATFAAELRRLIEDPAAVAQRLTLCRQAAAHLSPERFDDAFDKRHLAMLEAAARSGVESPRETVASGAAPITVGRR